MQEFNFKKMYSFQFILLTFLFRPPRVHRKYQLQDLWSCALAWFCQKHHLTAHTHTHTQHTSSTLQWQLFSLQHSLFTRNTAKNRERPPFVECCSSTPYCVIVSCMFFTMGFQETTWYFLTPSRKE